MEGVGEGEGEGTEGPAAIPLDHPQIRTLWNGVEFDSQRIERDGMVHGSGYIRNLNS
jgi:hypothetical protein